MRTTKSSTTINRRSTLISLYDHQREAVEKLGTGSILNGGVGSGKSLTSIYYFYTKECGGRFETSEDITPPKRPKDLYVITSAKKRDSLDWERECAIFAISKDRESSIRNIKLTVDSWNNIKKYVDVENAFFIFDEQRVVGSGVWVKSFLKITKKNNWILLSATPGDTWLDYIPVFIANGFYKNRTEFVREHVVFNSFVRFPMVDRFVGTEKLERLKRSVLVVMDYKRKTKVKSAYIQADYDQELFSRTIRFRWNPFREAPIRNVSELYYTIRRIVNAHPSRIEHVRRLLEKHQRLIVFYNFNYELELLRPLASDNVEVAEYNGHKHEPIPEANRWVYLVQYTAGYEAWNCTETNVVVFYSLNYSYRIMKQSAGRIDRLNTPFTKLYYYRLVSSSSIDNAIRKALSQKKDFNEKDLDLSIDNP